MRSQYRDTGLKASFTDTSWLCSDSSCWSTGATFRRAKISPGSSRTGMRLMVAVAAPVIMFVAPGPIEDVQTNVCLRFFAFANAVAMCTAACSEP